MANDPVHFRYGGRDAGRPGPLKRLQYWVKRGNAFKQRLIKRLNLRQRSSVYVFIAEEPTIAIAGCAHAGCEQANLLDDAIYGAEVCEITGGGHFARELFRPRRAGF